MIKTTSKIDEIIIEALYLIKEYMNEHKINRIVSGESKFSRSRINKVLLGHGRVLALFHLILYIDLAQPDDSFRRFMHNWIDGFFDRAEQVL